jgi:hypothetical protein
MPESISKGEPAPVAAPHPAVATLRLAEKKSELLEFRAAGALTEIELAERIADLDWSNR